MPHNRSIITTGGAFAALMTTSPVPDTPQTISRPFADAPVSVDKHSIPDPAFPSRFCGGQCAGPQRTGSRDGSVPPEVVLHDIGHQPRGR